MSNVSKYKVVILPNVKTEFVNAKEWYRSIKTTLPRRLMKDIQVSIDIVAQYPFSRAILFDNIRRINLEVFPYCLFYEINEELDKIIFVAFHHQSQNPGRWLHPGN